MDDYLEEGDWTRIEINCPRCGNYDVVVDRDRYGYYKVVLCHKCGYKTTEYLEH